MCGVTGSAAVAIGRCGFIRNPDRLAGAPTSLSARFRQSRQAIDDNMTHFFNPAPPIGHRAPQYRGINLNSAPVTGNQVGLHAEFGIAIPDIVGVDLTASRTRPAAGEPSDGSRLMAFSLRFGQSAHARHRPSRTPSVSPRASRDRCRCPSISHHEAQALSLLLIGYTSSSSKLRSA